MTANPRKRPRPRPSMKFSSYSESAASNALRSLPRLSMDEYMVFVSEAMSLADPEKVARQKMIEKQITTPFRLHSAPGDAEAVGRKP